MHVNDNAVDYRHRTTSTHIMSITTRIDSQLSELERKSYSMIVA
jgi:hypothetical protein